MSDTITLSTRGLAEVTQEIREETGQFLRAALRIGRLLFEAKAMVEPGGWSKYIEENLPFSHSWANNYMKLYKEYGNDQTSLFGNSQAFVNLRPTQALALLSVPAEEREAFAEENDIENKSTRQIQQLIRERDKALQDKQSADDRLEDLQDDLARAQNSAETARQEAKDYLMRLERSEKTEKHAISQVESLKKQLEKAKENEKKVKADLEKAKQNPEIPEAVMEQMRKEVEAKAAQEATTELQKQLDAAKAAAEEAIEARKKVEDALATAEKADKMQNPEVAVFQAVFIQLQQAWNATTEAYQKVLQSNEASAENCRKALAAVLQKFQSDIA